MRAAFEQIAHLVEQAKTIPGDFAEFGVWHGATFIPLAQAAIAVAKHVHAVDSFRGMAWPTEKDFDKEGKCSYPEGSLNVGGSAAFRQLVAPFGRSVVIWDGYIPTVLWRMGLPRFAFVHVDLDQYRPTYETLRWVWGRMSPGGILCCHDWYPEYQWLATQAIREWMTCTRVVEEGVLLPSHHIWFIKR